MRSIFELKGVERAAALLVALGPDTASQILRHLDDDAIERVSVEISKLGSMSSDERDDLIGEFLIELKKSKGSVQGGKDRARELLKEAFGEDKADSIINRLALNDYEKSFDFLHEIDTKVVVELIKSEQPQMIALTLSCLKPEKSADIIKNLPKEIAKESAVKIAKLGKFSPEAAVSIAGSLKKKYHKYLEQNSVFTDKPGVESLIKIIGHLDSESEKNILAGLEADSPELSSALREKIFTFDNILNLGNPEIRILIDDIADDNLIAVALKGAGDEIRFKVVRNMSRNRASDIISAMERMGPVRLSEVEDARSQITQVMRRLHENGEIDLRKDDIYVE